MQAQTGQIANRLNLALATSFAVLASPCVCFSQILPVCESPKNAVSISQASAAQANAQINIEKNPGNSKIVDGILHLYLRNDGPMQPDQLCASAHLSDGKDIPRTVLLSISSPGNDKSLVTYE